MSLFERITGRGAMQLPDQSWSSVFPLPAVSNYDGHSLDTERLDMTFEGYVRAGYQANGIVFALNMTRLRYFSQAEFKFLNLTAKNTYGTTALTTLEQPWPNGTTSDLLAKMIQHVDMAGNAFVVRRADRLEVLRPDWVQIVLAEVVDPQTGFEYDDVVGYAYADNGWPCDPDDMQFYDVAQVAHWAPTPDPLAKYRGMSWLTPVVRDINNDLSMGDYQAAYFRNNATPNAILKYPMKLDPASMERVRQMWNARHSGADNAFKTALLDMGADYTVIGSDMTKAAFNELRAKGETRVAAAAGVPPIVAGFSEGLAAATYSNYAQALRAFADGTLSHLWMSAAAALAKLVETPAGSKLVVDKTGIDALRDSERERAEAAHTMAIAAGELIRAGFKPDTVFPALVGADFSLLSHTGGIPTALYPDGQAPTPPRAEPLIADGAIRLELPKIDVEANTTIEPGAINASSSNNPADVAAEATGRAVDAAVEDAINRATVPLMEVFALIQERDAARADEMARMADEVRGTGERTAAALEELAKPRRTVKRIQRDADGEIAAVIEEEA